MTKSKDIISKEATGVITDENVAISLVFRNVPEDKRIELEKLAREFSKKKRKLVNYIEK